MFMFYIYTLCYIIHVAISMPFRAVGIFPGVRQAHAMLRPSRLCRGRAAHGFNSCGGLDSAPCQVLGASHVEGKRPSRPQSARPSPWRHSRHRHRWGLALQVVPEQSEGRLGGLFFQVFRPVLQHLGSQSRLLKGSVLSRGGEFRVLGLAM